MRLYTNEILLADDVLLSDGPVMFGVTAIDRDGNESDMVTDPPPPANITP